MMPDIEVMRVKSELLLEMDEYISFLDRRIYLDAYQSGMRSLEAQRDRAMSPHFQHSLKECRDKKMQRRNQLAEELGFGPRYAHDLSERDYQLSADGVLVHR